jgi:hypothetical protein
MGQNAQEDFHREFLHGMKLLGKKRPLTKKDIECLFYGPVWDSRWEWKDDTIDRLNLNSLGWTSRRGTEDEI